MRQPSQKTVRETFRNAPPDRGDSFAGKVEVVGRCWIWKGAKDSHGYGRLREGGRSQMAHRISWLWARGPIPNGLVIDHLCRTTSCVNPEHLEPVTASENTRRAAKFYDLRERTCADGHRLKPSPRDSSKLVGLVDDCWKCGLVQDRHEWRLKKPQRDAEQAAKRAKRESRWLAGQVQPQDVLTCPHCDQKFTKPRPKVDAFLRARKSAVEQAVCA